LRNVNAIRPSRLNQLSNNLGLTRFPRGSSE
jgi:hypothetical protein